MTNLLILDDDPLQHRLLQLMIDRYCPCEVHHCYNGRSVLNFLNSHKSDAAALPDLIFLDIHMPKVSGWQFLEAYKKIVSELTKDIKVYVVSSSADPRDLHRAQGYPFVRSYLIKPLSKNVLQELTAHYH